jgi:outer membrane usher protein
MTPSGRGIFFNYDLILSAAGEGAGLGGGLEVGYFSGSSFASSTSLVRWDREGTRFVRLDTSWRRDDPDGLTTLRVGDSISRGGAGTAPVRFGGVQYGRSFGLRPGFVTMPVPSIGGEATVPSVVDLYVNGILAGSRAVQPGPFQADDVPVVSGDGTVSAVVRDAAGRETVVSQNYYASPALLRPGMSDFSYEIGFLRQGYGVRSASYGAPFVSATHRRGLSDRLTIEGHAAASLDVQQAGAAADLALPRIGLIGGTIAASRSDRGVGGSAEIRFEHRGQVSLTGSAAFTSADFAQVGEARERRSASTTVQMFAGAPLRFGSLGIAYFLRDEAGSAWDVEHLGLRGSFPLGRLGTLYLSGRRSFGQDRELAIEARLSVRLGRETSASAELRRRDGLGEAYALVQRPVPFGEGFGYRAHAGFGSNGPGFGAWLGLNGPAGEYGAELTLRNGDVAGRVSAAGAIGLLDGDLFVSRPLNQSFAVVTVGGQENVRVYADNHLVARTGRNGRAIVPRLRAYERNLIRLEYADLPLDAEVAQGARAIRPYARGGVSVRFSARRRRGGMVRIEIEGGDPLPAGSRVRLGGREFLVAHGGQVYLEGLEPANELEISWAAGTCSLRLIVPDGPDPQPDLGIRRCTPRPD